ncbi:MAG: hypothetical protein CMJ32_02025 [Phycisphaerae bacterium]|nr:hypothetical protein [Phycisphaerae bacterium]
MPHLVLVSYYFPPDGGAGTQRPVSFARHLATLGWAVTVITKVVPGQRQDWEPEDSSLESNVPDSVRVLRVGFGDGSSPDSTCRSRKRIMANWARHAGHRLDRLLESETADVVLVTMSPFEAAGIPARINAASASSPRVVFDLRDPWALDGWRSYRTRFHWKQDLARMDSMFRHADMVIANTPGSRAAMLERFRSAAHVPVEVLTNGWNIDDFQHVLDTCSFEPRTDGGVLEILHAGTLHSNTLYPRTGLKGRLAELASYRPEPINPTGRTPYFLLEAIRRIVDSGACSRRPRLKLLGDIDPATRRCIEESGVQELVDEVGYLPHQQSVEALCRADVLFLPLHGLPEGRRALITPGKTYEYLASGRPILGAMCDSDARDLVASVPGNQCVEFDDIDGMCDSIMKWQSLPPAGTEALSEAMVRWQNFERSRIAGNLDQLLRGLLESREA